MDTLLIVLVATCALGAGLPMARRVWVRARSVERHHQALDTLGDITQRPDGAGPYAPPALSGGEHQAHVRIVGAGAVPAPLPPPRPGVGGHNASPFRRPSRSGPSVAALDAIATSSGLGSSRRPGPLHSAPVPAPPRPPALGPPPAAAPSPALPALPAPPAPAAPAARPAYPLPLPGAAGGGHDHTMPGLRPPEAPGPIDERATRPVPVARSEVFSFDDLGGRPAPAERLSHPAEGEAPRATTVPGPRPGPAAEPSARRRRYRRLPLAAGALAAVSVCAGLVAVVADLEASGTPPGAGRAGPAAGHAKSTGAARVAQGTAPTTVARHPRGTSGRSRSPAPSTTTVPVTTTTSAPSAALVSADAGTNTATYHLSSPAASIVVTARGACWLEVRAAGASGQVVYEGTLEAGRRWSVTGPAWIRLGDPPQVSVTVNGKRLGPPGAEVAAPLNLQFTVARTA